MTAPRTTAAGQKDTTMTTPRKTSLKPRKLYQVRHDGRQVGHKARLLPRHAAQRVARRLKDAGLFVYIDPILVNVSPAEAANLARRYG